MPESIELMQSLDTIEVDRYDVYLSILLNGSICLL